MEKFVIREGQSNQQKTQEEPSKKKWKQQYEINRNASVSRELMGKWLNRYKWLEVHYTADGKQMSYCKWCRHTRRNNSFSNGTEVFKADSLTKHERIEDHKFAQVTFVSDEPARSWEKAVESANAKAATAVKGAMNIVYYQAKENIATRKIKSLKELCCDLGAGQLKDLEVDKHTNYESYDAVHEMEEAIATVIKRKIMDRIKNSRWYSVCIDESTDISVIQSVIIYLKSVNMGKLYTDFLQLENLPGCTANEIYTTVCKVLSDFGVKFEKLSSVGSDGASVMTGHRTGVATLFKQHNSYMIPIHCAAHRLALASGQAADTVPYLLKFQEIMNKTFKYFEYSSKRTRALKAMQTILEQAEKKFVQIFHTRWLSFFGALEAINCNWAALVSVLMQDKSALSQGLLKNITNYKFLSCASFLSDVLYIINQLCLTFQKEDINFNTVVNHVQACIGELKNIKSKHTGTKYLSFLEKVPKTATPEGFNFEGHHIRDSYKMRTECDGIFKAFIDHVIQNITERLGNIGQIEMFTFMLPTNIPDVTDEEFGVYGADKIANICKHFQDHSELSKVDAVTAEWQLFKRILAVRCKGMSLTEVVKFLHDQSVADLYPLMISLFDFMISLPMSTVDCERGFSAMNLTKTSLRNRMSVQHLSTLLMISINGVDRRKFNFDKAFSIWCSTRERRVVNRL